MLEKSSVCRVDVFVDFPGTDRRRPSEVASHIKFRSSHLRDRDSDLENREDFWRIAMKGARPRNEASNMDRFPPPGECEAKLERDFGRHLKGYFRRELLRARSREAPVNAPELVESVALDPLAGLFFEVADFGYGSLYFPVDVAGVEKLVKVIGSDFEAFQMMLNAFIPWAFLDALDVDMPASNLQFYARVNPALKSTFVPTAPGNQVPPANNQPTALPSELLDRATWVWKVANFTLIPLVLVALVLCYMSIVVAEARHEATATYFASVQAQQERLLESYEKRESELSSSNNQLAKVLLSMLSTSSGENAANTATPANSAPPDGSAGR